ncbi:MAG: carboxypeptidase-like regulatory domain-containing protein [Candidatus Solibacter sp.]
MTRCRFRLAALFLGAAGLLSAAGIEGRVIEDHTGNPLASVEVRIAKIGQRTLAAHLETDSSGQFKVPNLAPGEYRIDAAKSNFIGATVRLAALPGPLTIRLVRCAVIAGQVVDAQGQPVLGATVYALPKPLEGPLMPYSQPTPGTYTRVGERGQYRLHSLPPGEYAVVATYGASTAIFGSSGGADTKPGIGSGVQAYPTNQRPRYFAVAGGEVFPNIDFSIAPSGLRTISGKVELPDAKSRYWLALTTTDQPGLATAVTATNADGTFRFEGVPAGSYTITASGPVRGYGGKAILADAQTFGRAQVGVASDVEGLTIALQKPRSASFIMKSAPGTPAEGGCPATAQVTLTALEDFAAQIDRSGTINAVKEQTVANLAPARYRVGIKGLGEGCYLASSPVLDLSAGAPSAVIALQVAAAGSIRGKLSGAPNPQEFSVVLLAADADTGTDPVQVVFPDSGGKFAFASLRPGRYRIATQPAGTNARARWVTDAAHMIEIQIVAGAPTEMELPAPRSQP